MSVDRFSSTDTFWAYGVLGNYDFTQMICTLLANGRVAIYQINL